MLSEAYFKIKLIFTKAFECELLKMFVFFHRSSQKKMNTPQSTKKTQRKKNDMQTKQVSSVVTYTIWIIWLVKINNTPLQIPWSFICCLSLSPSICVAVQRGGQNAKTRNAVYIFIAYSAFKCRCVPNEIKSKVRACLQLEYKWVYL